MGNTLWIESRGRPRAETQRDLSILGKLDRELDKLAMRLGVTTLSSFYDDSVLIESYAELAEEAAVKAESPVPKWFDSIKGLETIKALRDRLRLFIAAQEKMRMGGPASHPAHPWINWVQAHSTRKALDRRSRLA